MADASKPNFKETLLLPKTDFPMRGNLPVKEPERLKRWEDDKIYFRMLEKNRDKNYFYMPDGPPYANGDIHIGHTLNKTLKDIVIKYKNMSGHYAPYIPGWDCHGLPIEMNVVKALKEKRKDTSDADIRKMCRDEAHKWVNTQREQFKRLGIFGDWENPYLTLLPKYEAEEVRVLAKIFRNGILYRGKKPVFWCTALQTALAAAEVEYHDHTSLSVFVKFRVNKDLEKLGNPDKSVAFVVWTTTPWTLPANYATAVHPKLTYGLFDTGEDYIIIAKDLKESIEKTTGLSLKLEREYQGSELEGIRAEHPFMGRDSPVVLADYVLNEATGVVHTAPGHGMDDYVTGLRYKLPVESPVTEDGHYTDEVPKQYRGLSIWQANKKIVEDLNTSGHLLAKESVTHSYPYNPRGKTPLIFRATDQWFIKMDDENFPLRKKALAACESKIEFFPKWGKQRLESMISNTPDWCLSRQRIWGVPIPVFYCNDCGEPLIDADIMETIADKMESTEAGIEAYHSTPAEEFTAGAKCTCGGSSFKHGQDILDVWFDSGVCHTAGPSINPEMKFPADIYLEGSDQHRGWFQTSLLSSIAANDELPFKALITHGFVNDSQGLKMSKSKGNVVSPADIIKNSGAEILRLWTAYEDYGQDVTIGDEMFKRITETYRRIRNTMRFLLGNLHGFDPAKDMVAFKDMPDLDRWALIKLNELNDKMTAAYEGYDFYKIYHALNNFFTVELSATYLDILKDRLYTWEENGNPRRSSQTVFYHMLHALTSMMAPVLSFTSEEVYGYVPGDKKESVFLTEFPTKNPEWSESGLVEKFTLLFEVRDESAKILEDMRKNKIIGSSLDAQIKVTAPESHFRALNELNSKGGPNFLQELLIVSAVSLEKGDSLKVVAEKADGDKCQRCWHYSTNLSTINKLPGVCPKCAEAMK